MSEVVGQLEKLVAEAREATAELRETVREAHGVRKDLMALVRQVNEALDKAGELVSDQLKVHVKHHTEELGKLFQAQGAELSQRLFKKFEEITNILLGRVDDVDQVDLKTTAMQVRAAMGGPRNGAIPDAYRRPQ